VVVVAADDDLAIAHHPGMGASVPTALRGRAGGLPRRRIENRFVTAKVTA